LSIAIDLQCSAACGGLFVVKRQIEAVLAAGLLTERYIRISLSVFNEANDIEKLLQTLS